MTDVVRQAFMLLPQEVGAYIAPQHVYILVLSVDQASGYCTQNCSFLADEGSPVASY